MKDFELNSLHANVSQAGDILEITIDHDTGHVTVLGYPDPEIIQEIEDIIGMPLTRRSEF